jgi:hypothetical protein
MPRKPQQAHRNVIHLRLDEGLRQRLQREADRHRFTLTNEIRVRLLDSFDRDIMRGLDNSILDMQTCWGRFSARFLRMDLGDQLADAVVKSEDPNRIRVLAQLIIKHRATEQLPNNLGGAS